MLSDADRRILILFNDTTTKAIDSKFYQERYDKTPGITVNHQYDKNLNLIRVGQD